MTIHFTKKEVFAAKLGYKPEELKGFLEYPDGGAVGLIPSLAKYRFTAKELNDYELVMIARAEAVETKAAPSIVKSVSKSGMETKQDPPAAIVVSKPKKGRGGSATHPPKK